MNSLDTLNQTLAQIDAETSAKIAENADKPTVIEVTEVLPPETNPENDGTPVVSAETLIPDNQPAVIDVIVETVSTEPATVETAPVVTETAQTQAVGEQTPAQTETKAEVPAPAPVSIPVPIETENRQVNFAFPKGNFSKHTFAKVNGGMEYVVASGIVNFLEINGVLETTGKQPALGRGKPTTLYKFVG